MKTTKKYSMDLLVGLLCCTGAAVAHAGVVVQCPTDENGNAVSTNPDVICKHLVAGDGFVTMGDGSIKYIFGFADVTGLNTATQVEKDQVVTRGILAQQWPAPTIVLEEGKEFYLSLTNVGMLIRPDLFDPHTVHFHGFPQSSTVFDGLPESGIAVNMGSTLTYYYKLNDPGTYMYHCHVEATEHMQMGMLGNIYVKPAQDGTAITYNGKTYTQFAYNDGDGSTGYDVDYPIQLGSFDAAFHDASESVQPLPFALMRDDYPMINGRGYPDTADSREATFPPTDGSSANPTNNPDYPQLQTSQPISSLIQAVSGQKILLRMSNLAITRYYTLQSSGIKMKVVGRDAKLLRAQNGTDLYYEANSITLGGGESADVILDTAGVAPGTYVLYTSNLNYLNNDEEEYGGMMTEIVIN
jgi:FtsP/CotA-like multicopper oxidase with cupredoxin domain